MMVASRIERSKSRAVSGKELQGLSAGAKTPGRGGRGCVKAGVGSLSSDMLPSNVQELTVEPERGQD